MIDPKHSKSEEQSSIFPPAPLSLEKTIEIYKHIPEPPALLSCCADLIKNLPTTKPTLRLRPAHTATKPPFSFSKDTKKDQVGFSQIRQCEEKPQNRKPTKSIYNSSGLSRELSIATTSKNSEQKTSSTTIATSSSISYDSNDSKIEDNQTIQLQ